MVKASHSWQLNKVKEFLKSEFKNLNLELEVSRNPINNWIQVSLTGEDQVIATSYINKKIGTCPANLENAKNLPVLSGFVKKLDFNRQELLVDVGIFEPKTVPAILSVARLQVQLVNGKAVDLKKITEMYSLAERLPLRIKPISSATEEAEGLQAELALEQVEKLHAWQQSLLDRLIILGASKEKIDEVLERTRLNRDVIDVETLGMFEFALTCKLGTYAAGLVGLMGRYLRNSVFVVFNAKKSFELMSEHTLTL